MKFLLAGLLLCSTGFAATSQYRFPQGKVSLIADSAWTQGKPSRVGLFFEMIPDWHVYWKNSGDSGVAPKWNWKIENGKVNGEHWPLPKRIPVSDLTNLAYEKSALFTFDIAPDKSGNPVRVNLNLEFLICKVECIPYFTDLEIDIPYATVAKRNPLFDEVIYPSPDTTGYEWKIQERALTDLRTRLTLPENLRNRVKTLEVFPLDGSTFKPSAPLMEVAENHFDIAIPFQDTQKTDFAGSKFLVVIEDIDGKIRGVELALAAGAGTSFFLVLLWALLGGVILNVMPCVFPVLSIKVLSFMGPDRDPKKLRLSGILYTLGVLVSFVALGGSLLALRAAGEQIGWGFQLQSPVIAAGIALLFFWMGLNFLGMFEIGNSLTGVGGSVGASSKWGSFFTGVLATIVATPCTAPFMGAALGASLAMPAWNTLIIFLGLGIGMAAPFLAIAFFPPLLRFLPRPGAWMVTVKEFLSFPLFATVLWLMWVLSYQVSVDTLLFLLCVILGIVFWIWLSQRIHLARARQLFLMVGFTLSFAVLAALPKEKAGVSSTNLSNWKDFSRNQVETDLKEGRAVFIDFTAAWCITCQVNKKLVLNTDGIQSLFRENGVQLYRADWTDRNPIITQALASYGRNSLPLYVYYSAHSSRPILLPEILTTNIVRDLFHNKEKNP